jgi:monovalent cation/proton antiporter MnhG/PhaG subunit
VNVAIDVLLVVGVALDLLCVVGLVAMQDVFGRLHFIGPTALGTTALAAAIIMQEGASQLSVKAALVWAIGLVAGPVGVHAVARAARVRQFDGWAIQPEEKAQAEL